MYYTHIGCSYEQFVIFFQFILTTFRYINLQISLVQFNLKLFDNSSCKFRCAPTEIREKLLRGLFEPTSIKLKCKTTNLLIDPRKMALYLLTDISVVFLIGQDKSCRITNQNLYKMTPLQCCIVQRKVGAWIQSSLSGVRDGGARGAGGEGGLVPQFLRKNKDLLREESLQLPPPPPPPS